MNTLLITHPSGLQHLTPLGHPERPDRLRALEQVFEQEKFQDLIRVEAPSVPLETITLCHPMDYVEALRHASPKEGIVAIDADTSMSPGSFEAAVRAVGGAVHAVNEVVGKRADNAFVCMRPPGHHTETARAMGFCLFNTAAIAARYAQDHHGLDRVAVIDFDVHHGNGTQAMFWERPDVFYASLHVDPAAGWFPHFVGSADEVGAGAGAGATVNAPLAPGTGDTGWLAALDGLLGHLTTYRPEALVVSLGVDAAGADPESPLDVSTEGFAAAGARLAALGLPTVLVHEGGYALDRLGVDTVAVLRAFGSDEG